MSTSLYSDRRYALIPARSGSKSIPKKNLQRLGDCTLLERAIRQAKACSVIDEVFVSTDCPEIRDISLSAGARAPFLRPPEISGDLSPDILAFQHWLEQVLAAERQLPGIVVHLRATSPFRTIRNIEEAISILEKDPRADSVRAVIPPQENPYKMWTASTEGYLVPLLGNKTGESCSLPRQALPATLWQTATVDAIRTPVIWEKNSMTGKLIKPLLVSAREAVDIDTAADLNYAIFLEQG